MPLDGTGSDRPPENRGMLVLPAFVADHYHGLRAVKLWTDTAATLLSWKIGVPVSELYVTTSHEITTGHLERYREKTGLLGTLSKLSCDGTAISPELQLKCDFPLIKEGDKLNLPRCVERMLVEQRPFHVIAEIGFNMLIQNVDVKRSGLKTGIKLNGYVIGSGLDY